jgi:hypothetical protein
MNVIKNIVRRKELQGKWVVDDDENVYLNAILEGGHDTKIEVQLTNYEEVISNVIDFIYKKCNHINYGYDIKDFHVNRGIISVTYTTLLSRLHSAVDKYHNDGKCMDPEFYNMDFEYNREILLENAVQLYIYTQFFMPFLIYGYGDSLSYCISSIYSSYKFHELWLQTKSVVDSSQAELDETGKNTFTHKMLDILKLTNYSIYNIPLILKEFTESVLQSVMSICILAKFTYSDFLAAYLILISEYDLNSEEYPEVSSEVAAEYLRNINIPDLDYMHLLRSVYTIDCTEVITNIFELSLRSDTVEDNEEDKPEKVEEKPELDIRLDHDTLYQTLSKFNECSEETKEEFIGKLLEAFSLVLEKDDLSNGKEEDES